ncbi:YeeE/YedE family protein [Alishewanella sp. 16-MA]|uniref:YeeE/YedE family protein n=1 Tax=Alishewanella maricola TaxID=2795740 RepID=A0ABS8C6M7_9ALTE|nr:MULTISPECIES: YeeE/YedE thiosulfate transporter family protein [Gammaproteobacteria]MDP4945944.1 YeeE/YedE thiosulfate transporter family protein [Alishewanella sp.]MCB5227988.1 YeeE/YedE family protein [Alishewanella maricola]MCF4009029.1 YeeE/YedE family protein [Rheinheimera sp. UJ63]MDP5034777.1 YeeE/YedE thiosulfate transporter family protein [Alishewanella sp.]MDP5186507.1 YeeE/YedE thiosulfate transporter family protein [Alishewanella sp.]
MENFTPISALIGGSLIGFGALLMMTMLGRIAGISGIASQLIFERDGRGWRFAFVAGLLVAPLLVSFFMQDLTFTTPDLNTKTLIAGLLVGLGTGWGSGCTSGHGVCGIGRLSPRSISATLVFMAAGVLVASLF